MSKDPHNWVEANEILTRNGVPVPTRKVANHTYVQRRNGDRIAIKFHDTDVITYTPHGGLVLSSGGWLTMATKDRINRFTPKAVQVHSVKGRWMVTTHMTRKTYQDGSGLSVPDYDNEVAAFFDGVRLTPWASDFGQFMCTNTLAAQKILREDRHNARIERLLDAWLRGLTDECVAIVTSRKGHWSTYAKDAKGDWLRDENDNRIEETHTPEEGCAMCVRTDVGKLVGDSFEDVHHLIEHLEEKVYPYNLLRVASEQINDSGMRCTIPSLCKRDVRAYLRQKLYVGPVALAHGKRPRFAPSRSLERTR